MAVSRWDHTGKPSGHKTTDKTEKSTAGPFAMIVLCTGIGWFLGGVNGAVFGATFWSGAIVIAEMVRVYKAVEQKKKS